MFSFILVFIRYKFVCKDNDKNKISKLNSL
nr:MAG TPA: hypothetical protein [Caudoviricetes sp.]DAQ99438.1 MAG TPA: hypothetical protein [Caudoviricetes sp.]